MHSGTVSRVDVILEINGVERISCQLKRHFSPMTVGLITRILPLRGNAHHMGQSIYTLRQELIQEQNAEEQILKKATLHIYQQKEVFAFTWMMYLAEN